MSKEKDLSPPPCPECGSSSTVRNGKKDADKRGVSKQNYLCKSCGHQFIDDDERAYRGGHSDADQRIRLSVMSGKGSNATAEAEGVSLGKIRRALANGNAPPPAEYARFDELQVDAVYTTVVRKENKALVAYACAPRGEIVAFGLGETELEAARALRQNLDELGVVWNRISVDRQPVWPKVFGPDCRTERENARFRKTEAINCKLRRSLYRFSISGNNSSKKLESVGAAFAIAANHFNNKLFH